MLNKKFYENEYTNDNKNFVENHNRIVDIIDYINDLDDDVFIME